MKLDLDKYVREYKPPAQLAPELCDDEESNAIEYEYPDMLVMAVSALTGVSTVDLQQEYSQVRNWTIDTARCYCSEGYQKTMAWYAFSAKQAVAVPIERTAREMDEMNQATEIEAIFA